MNPRRLGVAILGAVLGVCGLGGGAFGQAPVVSPVATPAAVPTPVRFNDYYAAPGYYGMMLGSPSYGSVRTYTEFSSPYGAGYRYGYAPYGMLPGKYGVGLWRPSVVAPGYVGGTSYYSYRTFPVAGATQPPPAVGAYAPGFGPPAYVGW